MINSIFEIIGMNGIVIESTNRNFVGISGTIINETKNMLTLNTKLGEKSIPKNTCKLKISRDSKMTIINGSDLLKHPHERLEVLLWVEILVSKLNH